VGWCRILYAHRQLSEVVQNFVLTQLSEVVQYFVLTHLSPVVQVFMRQMDNGIPIGTWNGDPNDTALMDLLPLLSELEKVDDVRGVILERFEMRKCVPFPMVFWRRCKWRGREGIYNHGSLYVCLSGYDVRCESACMTLALIIYV
jgi:hypothetical protein